MSNQLNFCSHQSGVWVKTPDVDPRDIKIKIPYQQIFENNQFFKNGVGKKNDFKSSEAKSDLRKWLVNVYEIIASDSFAKFNQGILNATQVKGYASKNILNNICGFIRHISGSKQQCNRNEQLIKFFNEQSSHIIDQLLLKYPQNTFNGSCRMLKKIISGTDNRQSDQFDLLSSLPQKFLSKQDNDHSSQIMEAVNYFINLGNSPFGGKTFNITEIIEQLVDNACKGFPKQKDYSTLNNFQAFQLMIDTIFSMAGCQSFEQKFLTQSAYLNKKSSIAPKHYQNLFSLDAKVKYESKQNNCYKKQWQQYKIKTNQDINSKINQKIPAGVRQFNKKQIQAGDFSVPDVSVLRILTKWSQQLRQKIKYSRTKILQKFQLFRTKNNDYIYLDQVQKQFLSKAAQQKQFQINEYFNILRQANEKMQAKLAAQNNLGKYTNDQDTNIGMFAARNQSCVGQYTFRYLNQLISSLLKIPKRAAQMLRQSNVGSNYASSRYKDSQCTKLQSVDLISFKVGDLFRAKCIASEKHLIQIYKFIQKISQTSPNLFKIVRVKDRLDEKDNDILINFFFMKKIQCQIQLVISHPKGSNYQKLDNYNVFNHYWYELSRANFGPIAQTSCILSQYDAVVRNYTKRKNLGPSLSQPFLLKKEAKRKEIIHFELTLATLKKANQSRLSNLPFFCSKCKQFKRAVNSGFYLNRIHSEQFSQCNQCYQKRVKQSLQSSKNQNNQQKSVVMKQLLRQIFPPETAQFGMLYKHLKFFRTENISYLSDIPKQGLLILKNTKKPKPMYYQLVYFAEQYHFVSTSLIDSFEFQVTQKNADILLTLNEHDDIKLSKQILSKIHILSFDQDFTTNSENCHNNLSELRITNCTNNQRQSLADRKSTSVSNKSTLISQKSNIQSQANFDFLKKLDNKMVKEGSIKKDVKKITKSQIQNIPPSTNYKPNKIKKKKEQESIIGRCSCCPNTQIKFSQKFSDFCQKAYQIKNEQTLKQIFSKKKQIIHLSSRGITNQLMKYKNELTRVQRFYIMQNKLSSIQFILGMKFLQILDISGNQITQLTDLRDCINLQQLFCSKNLLQCLNGIQRCTKLKHLNCSFNHLKTLRGLQSCIQLHFLQCNQNQLVSLGGLKNCQRLTRLNCSSNNIRNLHALQEISTIQILQCNDNQLYELTGIQNCVKLESLFCGQNNLTSFKGFPKQCLNLQYLNFTNNRIKSIEELDKCKNILTFIAKNNKIQSIKCLENMKKLQEIDVSDNKIKSLICLEECCQLLEVDASNNPLQELCNTDNMTKLIKFLPDRKTFYYECIPQRDDISEGHMQISGIRKVYS